MHVIVTAGNTQSPIDRVRCITNIFSGKTGTSLAVEGVQRGHSVTLLTSHPELAATNALLSVVPYRTFDQLRQALEATITGSHADVLVHAAAINDYEIAGSFAPATGTSFDASSRKWSMPGQMVDVSAGKLSSAHPELWLRMTPTPKLADMVREPWGFRGTFVKFKLEVDRTEDELRSIAARARAQSDADLIVANTLDGYGSFALIGNRTDHFERVDRAALATKLWDRLERRPG